MRLFWVTALAMAAFAANSVLNRMAVAQYGMDPLDFAVLRLLSGAVVLALLVLVRGKTVWPGWSGRAPGVIGLLVYLFVFWYSHACILCIWLYLHVFVCICVYLCVFVCICLYLCKSICICVYLCVFVDISYM